MPIQANGTEEQNGGKTATAGAPGGSQDAPNPLAAKKAEIIAKARAADPDRAGRDASQQGDSGSSGVHAPAQAGSTPAPATATPTAAEKAIADLTAQVASLTSRLEAVAKPKEEPAPATQTEDKYTALVEAIEADPAALFDLLPQVTIEKLAEAHLRRVDNPAHGELTKHDKKIAELEGKLADRDKADADAKAKTEGEAAMKAGRDLVKAHIDGDKGRWARVSRSDENASEAIGLAIDAGRKVVAELRKTKGEKWLPSDDEAKAILTDCLDGIEKDFGARATRYGAPDIAPKTSAAPAAPERKTIPAAGTGGGAPRAPAEDKPPADLSSKKADILKRVRTNAARQPQD